MATKINSRKGIIMTKKEKIIASCLIFSFLLLIVSSIYTMFQIKPFGYKFDIQRWCEKIIN